MRRPTPKRSPIPQALIWVLGLALSACSTEAPTTTDELGALDSGEPDLSLGDVLVTDRDISTDPEPDHTSSLDTGTDEDGTPDGDAESDAPVASDPSLDTETDNAADFATIDAITQDLDSTPGRDSDSDHDVDTDGDPDHDAVTDRDADSTPDRDSDPDHDADTPGGLPPCDGDPYAPFDRARIDPPAPDSGDYGPPAIGALDALESSLEAALEADWDLAREWAVDAGYHLCEGADASSSLIRFTPLTTGSGAALIMIRPDRRAPLIVGTPHAYFEFNTLVESEQLFRGVGAQAWILSGTHRCASPVDGGCSGTTSVCTDHSAPYRESDMAHTERSHYHRAHVVLSEHFSDSLVLSIHGMSASGVSLSNGTTRAVSEEAPVAQLARALAAVLPGEDITTCNDYPGADRDLRLCGTTNTQGRHLNGATDACRSSASSASERFIHFEQSRHIRELHIAEIVSVFTSVVTLH